MAGAFSQTKEAADKPSVPNPLSLQSIVVHIEAPADTYLSGNSIYTCIARSGFSVGC